MMGSGHDRLSSNAAAAILLVVLLGNLSISVHCTRQQLPGVTGGGTAAAAAGRQDGSKIYLIFCQRSKCVDDRNEFTCYCCLQWTSLCWPTMEGCRSACPVCNPKCPPSLPQSVRRLPRAPTGVAGRR